MTIETLALQVFGGFSLFSVLVLMALGLTIVFGLMGVTTWLTAS
jgi:urea transport system permease protein